MKLPVHRVLPQCAACLFSHVVEVSGAYLGVSHCPALPFPPSHPEAMGALFPPPLGPSYFPGQVDPGHSTARGQNATFQWLHTPWGRAPDSFMGGEVEHGARKRGGEGKVQHRSFRPTMPTPRGPRPRDREDNRGPKTPPFRAGKRKPLTLFGFERKKQQPPWQAQ